MPNAITAPPAAGAAARRGASARIGLPKCPTGIEGLDQITGGGLPRGRAALVAGAAGSGKTLLATQFLAHGALRYGEPGVFMSFEERAGDLARNVASLGLDLDALQARKKLLIDHVRVERSEIEETGEYDLEGLFIRLGDAIDTVKAKRVVLDTLESLFAGLENQGILRAELRRLFNWLKDRGVTTLITGERGDGTLTRQGLEEYVSDCVILLDHRVNEQIATRRLRIVKYRGSSHGTNEYPFLIDEDGISVIPITSLGLEHTVARERVSTGVPDLDAMLGGAGVFRGSTVLVTGTAGTGKTSLAAHFVNAACRRGERCLYFAFEESRSQIARNMRSIGIDLEPWATKGLLEFRMARPSHYGLELHLATMHRQVGAFRPNAVVVDPVSSLIAAGQGTEVQTMLARLVDFLKESQVTTVMTALTAGGDALEATALGISSVVDTWILLRDIESGGERNRGMYVLKSRGMAHSNQIREFRLTSRGIELIEPYLGPSGLLTGSARVAREAEDRAATVLQEEEVRRYERELERKRALFEAQLTALKAQFETEAGELTKAIQQARQRESTRAADREIMRRSRGGGPRPSAGPNDSAGNGRRAGARSRPRGATR